MTVRELWSVIRKKCLECANHQPKEVRLCRIYDCPTWPYRMGKNHPVQSPDQADLVEIRSARKPKTQQINRLEGIPHVI